MKFEDFLKLEYKYLNLGSLQNVHPTKNYLHYIGINPPSKFQNKIIDLKTRKLIDHPENTGLKHGLNIHSLKKYPNLIYHDIEKPFPLPDNSVDRIHSEDCFEHIEINKYPNILKELFRILKPGGLFRFSVPDYMNPKLSHCLEKGYDPNNCLHITLTRYNLLKPIFEDSPFNVEFLHYWKNENEFIQKKIDYTKGYIKRTPDNDPRNKEENKWANLRITTVVCDLTK